MLEITVCPVSLPSFLNKSRFEYLLCNLLELLLGFYIEEHRVCVKRCLVSVGVACVVCVWACGSFDDGALRSVWGM